MTKSYRTIKVALISGCAIAFLFVMNATVVAQCSMCKAGIGGSPDAGKLSQSLNTAVIILLIPPVLIFCGLFFLAYRYRKPRGEEQNQSSSSDGRRARNLFTKSAKPHQPKKQDRRETGGATA